MYLLSRWDNGRRTWRPGIPLFLVEKEKLAKFLNNRQEEIYKKMERKQLEAKQEQQQEEEHRLTELCLRQEECTSDYVAGENWRRIWEVTHKRLELEKEAHSTTAELPKLIIILSKGMPTDWVRFEDMFVTQVQNKSISAEQKFGYLLEMVNPNVWAKIANPKPLKSEYGQSKLVVNVTVEEIVNLPVVKGSSYLKIHEFYESVSRNYDALLTMGKADMLQGWWCPFSTNCYKWGLII